MDKLLKKYQELVTKEASLKIHEESLALLKNICVKFINFNIIEKKSKNLKMNGDIFPGATIEEIIKNWIYNDNYVIVFKNGLQNKNTKIELSNSLISLNYLPWYISTYENFISNEGYSFIMDTIFIVFHNEYFALLPNFKKDTITHNLFIKIFLAYSNLNNNPEDSYQIKAMCYEATGQFELAGDYYYKSLLATSSDDPSFITALQDYWSFLVERGELQKALDSLLNIKTEKLIKDTDSYNELIRSTFRIANKKKKLQSA